MLQWCLVFAVLLLSSVSAFVPLLRNEATSMMRLKAKASAASSQIRVRFLSDVKGQGKKGEVAFVSATLYQNVLASQRLAERVSDEQFEKETAASAAADKEEQTRLSALGAKILEMAPVQIKKKIGENGKIFGAITRKSLLETLRSSVPDSAFSPKTTVIDIVNLRTGSKIDSEDIREAGSYSAKINLGHVKVEPTNFKLDIVSEK
jgi:large subunit ribosomal protein L9